MEYVVCPQNDDWAGWALPMNNEGYLLHLALYCRDVLKFAEAFLERTQIGNHRAGPRCLDGLVQHAQQITSLEDRNRAIIRDSFFLRGFGPVRDLQQQVGVQYTAVSAQVTRNEDLAIVHRLEPGTLQFFAAGSQPGPAARSVWVSAEGGGWFYVVTYKQAINAQSPFKTPDWILQARKFQEKLLHVSFLDVGVFTCTCVAVVVVVVVDD